MVNLYSYAAFGLKDTVFYALEKKWFTQGKRVLIYNSLHIGDISQLVHEWLL